jgi:vancomycin resistance protein YoaR
MEVLERHRHFWPVSYARPGLDAAVAYPKIDLRFRNPLPAPLTIRARRRGEHLIVELLSTESVGHYAIETDDISVDPPSTIVRYEEGLAPGQFLQANRGQAGRQVGVYRLHHTQDGCTERTLVSLDSYPALNRIIKVGVPRR